MGYAANQLGYVAKQVYKLQIKSDVKIINLTVFYFLFKSKYWLHLKVLGNSQHYMLFKFFPFL